MSATKKIQTALVSVYYKEGLAPIIERLHHLGVKLLSTGGTKTFIESLNIPVTGVEDLTDFPEILGGRVKTLHPKVFGGILGRRADASDVAQMDKHDITAIDLVIVDLYPFEETIANTTNEADIIEKIDIGGISLIRAAAKNFNDVVICASKDKYDYLLRLLNARHGETDIEHRRFLATHAFNISSHYDTAIFHYFDNSNIDRVGALKISNQNCNILRYGENPHQKGVFYGNIDDLFTKLNGKELSYNNLLDVDAAVNLMNEFTATEPTFAILKHNNACGLASRSTLLQAWTDALAADPTSAFGGVLISNTEVDEATATEINKLFFEVIIAPSFSDAALGILKQKINRVILVQKNIQFASTTVRTALNGYLVQDKDLKTEIEINITPATTLEPTALQIQDLIFANKLVKHTKSNTIVIAKNKQLIASGTGQTSRVDALQQAINKAKNFGFELKGTVMASDAFFPFADCVEIAHKEGIDTVIQPGGSIKDKDSIDYCNNNNMCMVMTGTRHFKH
ncbi:MAG: bifunctional phosphoribosylaminoimidazolecarboxamide formyltransferase/IMP cyclohydrolase [Bacteroidia bacterium]|nr:bifunctional phosphoribosylaminoimidazolecarboxamide formyltransferase/IMP cyclohydrolase [Bacteroidia bacterium]